MSILSRHLAFANENFSATSLKHFISNIYESDRRPSFYKFHETADWIVSEFTKLGIQSQKLEFPADGKTKYGDWVSPLAWDAYDLKLTDLNTKELIADYQKISTHMVIGSGPTPKEGFTGEVVFLEAKDEIHTKDVRGKFILTKFSPQSIKRTALEKGALAFLFHGDLESFQGDLVRWVNAWSDDPALWFQTAQDTVIPGVSLSPNMVDFYRDKILKGETVRFELKVDTKFYHGTLPVVEAFIPGIQKEEVFFTGHLFEQGANDNASGCATMMEIARAFSKQKPQRGLRFLFTSELYGTVPYTFENLDILRNVIAGINIDSTAEVGRKSNKMEVIQNPNTNPSYVNLLMHEFVDASGNSDRFAFKSFLLDDNMVTDPQINIPAFLIGVCSYNWHTSNDTLDIIDWDLFNLTTTLCIAWASFIVQAKHEEALYLKEITDKYLAEYAKSKLEKPRPEKYVNAYTHGLIQEVTEQMYATINKISPVVNVQTPSYTETGPLRNYFGPPSYGDISPNERNSLGMWSSLALYPQFWANGKRSKERIVAYTALEFNVSPHKPLTILNTLYKNKYLSDIPNCHTLTIDCKRIGVRRGDIIIVHGSMKNIGKVVDGGAEAVIQALIDAVGAEGTIIFPTFVNPTPLTDLRTAPSRLGLLSETFRRWPDSKRSNNPTHCVSAIGAHAKEILEDHEKTTQLGVDSPLHKASKMGAKVLHLGTTLTSCSLIHVGEAIAKVPFLHVGYSGYDGDLAYIDQEGVERHLLSKELPGDSAGFPKLHTLTKIDSKLSHDKIGNAKSFLVKGEDLLNCTAAALAKDPFALLCDNPRCSVCVNSRKVGSSTIA